MASILIPEDGSNVANANSYADLTFIRAYAASLGYTLTGTDPGDDALALKAMNFIESQRSKFQGMKTYTDQTLQFPRSQIERYDSFLGNIASATYGILIDCVRIDNDVIPIELKNLLCECVLAVNAGVDFSNYGQEQKFVVKEEVGPLKVTYANGAEGGSNAGIPFIDSIQNMLDLLFYPCGQSSGFTTVRV